jgi:hypothetical protein
MRSEPDDRRRSNGHSCSVAIGNLENEIAITGTVHAAIAFTLAGTCVLKTEAGEA